MASGKKVYHGSLKRNPREGYSFRGEEAKGGNKPVRRGGNLTVGGKFLTGNVGPLGWENDESIQNQRREGARRGPLGLLIEEKKIQRGA